MRRSTTLAGNALLLVASTFLALGLAELAARWFVAAPIYRASDFSGFQRELENGYLVPDRVLGFAPGPTWEGPTGRRGFQNGAEYGELGREALDVVFLGDSVIQSRLLQSALNEFLTGTSARTWNAGIAGYNTLQEAYYLEQRIALDPDVLILGFCLNDFLPSMSVTRDHSDGYGPMTQERMTQNLFEPIGVVSPFWFQKSALYRLIKLRTIAFLGSGDLWSAETVRGNRWLVAEGLARVRRYARDHDATLLVVVYPYLTAEDPYLKTAHETVLAILRDLDIAFIDMKAVYRDRGDALERLRKAPDDVVHPNAEGHMIAAVAIARRLAPQLGVASAEVERLASERLAAAP
jgi:lysophospholipase L1-like esterase